MLVIAGYAVSLFTIKYTVMSTQVITIDRVQSIYESEKAAYEGKNFDRTKRGRELLAEMKEVNRVDEARNPSGAKHVVSLAEAKREHKRIYGLYGQSAADKYAESVTTVEESLVSKITITTLNGTIAQQNPTLLKASQTPALSLMDGFRSTKQKVEGKVVMVQGKIWTGVMDGKLVKLSWARKDRPIEKPQAFLKVGNNERVPVRNYQDCLDVIAAS